MEVLAAFDFATRILLFVKQFRRAKIVKTTIVNATTHVLNIQERSSVNGNFIVSHLATVPSMQNFIMDMDPYATFREYELTVDAMFGECPLMTVGNQLCNFSSDDLYMAAEITVFETRTRDLECHHSKMRTDSTAFDAVKEGASSRMKIIEKSHANLVLLLRQVKICPAQCQNLVQTCEGVKLMKEAYSKTSENELWQLFMFKKLGQLISSLDKLLSTLGSIQDLLQACGSNWGSMALVVSLPMPPPERMYSKFDILIKELHWNLETIHYALDLNEGVEFKWNESKSRYVLVGAKVPVADDMEPEQSRGLASEDREQLLSQLENGSILVPGNPLLYHSGWHFGFKFAADNWRDRLAAELQKRLKEPADLSNDSSSALDCFWINSEDLKLRREISKNFSSKSVWKGEWCGQAVAIGITKDTTKAAVQKEAGLLLKVQHPNIVGFLGCAFTDEAPPPVSSGEDDKCSAGYLVMELMHADLWHVIDRRAKSYFGSPFTLTVAVDILLQIAGGMVHMHNLNIMHRDLKSSNCLVNPRSSSNSSTQVLNFHALKLIDFDLSKELDPIAAISKHSANAGTRRWMAPEVWGVRFSGANNSERVLVSYTKSADVWSFGMTCYEVITGLLPFHECVSNQSLVTALRDGKRPLIPASVSCPEGLKALMSRCWAQEPSDRPDFKDIVKDLWTIKYQLEIQ